MSSRADDAAAALIAELFGLRDGRIYRTKVHADPREALEAAGLDPAES